MKFKQPSLGTKAAIFLPFFTSWTRAHLRIAELGCLASIPLQWNKCTVSRSSKKKVLDKNNGVSAYIFSRTMPLAWDDPAKGFFHSLPK
jgi:hypothetical protein